MILLFIIGISVVQIALYFLNGKYKTKFPNYLILIFILLGHYLLFPRFFYPEPRTDGINCGMPILGITLGFWIFGTIAGITTHLIWKLIIKKNKAHKHNTV